MPHLSLSLLGSLQVTLDGQSVTGFKSDKVRALLAYLAVEAGRPRRRETLAGLLWPGLPDQSARSNLRSILANLRKVIGDHSASPPFLLITRDTLQFNPDSDFWLDVAAFDALVAIDQAVETTWRQLEEAVALYRGDFLEGFSLSDSAAFEDWALFSRESLSRQMSSALHRLSEIYEQRGEYEQAQTTAWRQVELEPWDELAHQRVMRSLALGGQRSAALAQYKACCRLLAKELGVEPAEETTALYEQIRDGKLKDAGSYPARPAVWSAGPPSFLDGEEAAEVEVPVFVARERELAQLDGSLDLALAGQGRVVFVTGEAGSGKTSLVQEFTRRAQELHADLIVATGNSNAHTGIGDPYLPFREILAMLTGDVEARWAAGTISGEHARRLWRLLPLAAEALVEAGPDLIDIFVPGAPLFERAGACSSGGADWLARLGELVERRALRWAQDATTSPPPPSPQQSALFEQYAKTLQTLARQSPLVLVVDDLQWADPGSISLLFQLGRQLTGNRVLIVGAYRREDVAMGREGQRHPLASVINEFQRAFGDITVDVDQAERREFVEALLDSEPNGLGAAFRQMLYRQTRGHPLFTVELLRGMQERGDLVQDAKGRWVEGTALDWETLPARVEAAIAERIGRLAQPLRNALRVASVEGVDFTAEVVARVAGTSEREMVRSLSTALNRKHRLVRAQVIERLGSRRVSRYRFRHNVFQRYLYENLDQAERAYLHEDVGKALEELYADQESEIATIALQLARHFQEARIPEKAIEYLHRAGDMAAQISAFQEGIAHLTRGLDLLMSLPDSPERAQKELVLRISLGIALKGELPCREGEAAITRALELCRETGKTSQLSRILGQMANVPYVRAEYQTARELGEETLSLAQLAGDPLLVVLGHWHMGFVLFGLGEYSAARAHLKQVISFYDPQEHHHPLVSLRGSDAGVSALAYDACCLWCLGYPEQAFWRSQEALALARELDHAFSLADVVCHAGCVFNEMRRDAAALKDDAEDLMQLSKEMSALSFFGAGTCYLGAALTKLGQIHDGLANIREGLSVRLSVGARCYSSGILGAMAEAQAAAGHPEEALTTLADALAMVEETSERYCEAELLRLQAELLLMQGDDAKAEDSFHKAIEVARRQGGKSWELRVATSLARLRQKQGRTEEAGEVLGQVYGWFAEGFDTPDLKEAKALLDEIG